MRNRCWFQLLLFRKRYQMHPKWQQVKYLQSRNGSIHLRDYDFWSGGHDTRINKSDDEMKPLNSLLTHSLLQQKSRCKNKAKNQFRSSMKPPSNVILWMVSSYLRFISFSLSNSQKNHQQSVFAIIFPFLQIRFIQPPNKEPSRNKKTPNPDTERDKRKKFFVVCAQ